MRKTTLKVGDLVVMNDKYYEPESHKGEVFKILKIGTIGGEKVAWLEGLCGCYALDGLMSEFDCGWAQGEDEDIDIEYLSEQKGVMRYGNCIACGKGSSEDRNMRWVTFGKNRQSMTRIALCENCSKKLAEML